MIVDLPAPQGQRTPEQAREILVHAWRDPRPEMLIQASADQARRTAPASAAGVLALIESLPVHERADHLELYTTRQGRPRAADGTMSRSSLNAERVARWVQSLDLQPGDVLYIALFGWTKWDLHVTHWVVPVDITAPEEATPDREGPDRETPDRETPDRETPDRETPDQESPERDNEANGAQA